MADKGNGKKGEDYAADQLQESGYRILARNFRSPYGEIDIVAQKDKYILFIEVKTRAYRSLGTPAQAVTVQKQKKIILTAHYYFSLFPSELQPRFDICEVTTRTSEKFFVFQYQHIEGAFDVNGDNWHD